MIVNCTPHPVTIAGVTIAPSGILPRVSEESTPDGAVDHDGVEIPIVTVSYGAVYGLPEPEDGTLFAVSRMVAEAAPERADLVFPTRQTRDEAGRINGCQALGRPA